MIDPELELDALERSDLAMTCSGKGWSVIQKIALSIVEQLRVDLDNASKPSDVLEKHALSKAASTVYTMLLMRISNELAIHTESKKTEPQESAPGLEMDDIAAAVDHLPNLLGDVAYIQEDDTEEGRL